MNRPNRIKLRNDKLRQYIAELEKKHPQWRWDALLSDTADKFFLAERTVDGIVRREGCYAD